MPIVLGMGIERVPFAESFRQILHVRKLQRAREGVVYVLEDQGLVLVGLDEVKQPRRF
jgi:hypothetical protein